MYNSPYAYFPTYQLTAPLYNAVNTAVRGTTTRVPKKSSRQKYQETQERLSGYLPADQNTDVTSSTTLGKEFSTSGNGKNNVGNYGGSKTNESSYNSTGSYNANVDDAVYDAGLNAAKGMASTAALNTGLAYGLGLGFNNALGIGLGAAFSPANTFGALGSMAAAKAGISTNATVSGLLSGLASMSLGPIGGALVGAAAPFAVDAIADALDARSLEATKDSLEDTHGYFGGRQIARGYETNLANPLTASPMAALTGALANQYGIDRAATMAQSYQNLGLSSIQTDWGIDQMGYAQGYANAMANLGDLGINDSSVSGVSGGFANTDNFGGIGTDKGGFGASIGGTFGGGAMSHGAAQSNFGGIGGFAGGLGDTGLSSVGGVSSGTAASTSASAAEGEASTASGTATGGSSDTNSGTTGEGGASESNADSGTDSSSEGASEGNADSGGASGFGGGTGGNFGGLSDTSAGMGDGVSLGSSSGGMGEGSSMGSSSGGGGDMGDSGGYGGGW